MVNPLDRPALSLAVALKARFGQTTAMTMGPPQAREALYEALASGLDHGVHLSDPAFAGSDTLATARTLAACIGRRGADLILCGKYTLDGETAQVGPELAELLDLPHVAGVEHGGLQRGRPVGDLHPRDGRGARGGRGPAAVPADGG